MVDDEQRKRGRKQRYAAKLRVALTDTNTSVYRLARVLNAQQPESERSNLQRYLAAKVLPGPAKRIELAAILGRPELREAEDEAAEDAAQAMARDPELLVGALVDLVTTRIQQRMEATAR